ncbi:MAG: sugar phosphate isomerase/epimerase [Candidatus Omnitrophica bacterium]|nr:sugar phosphate isomerase/epimerase [Candidatus Omnitrophota bacterium]
MENLIIMHINYMEQGQTFDEICEKAVKLGFDGIEFRRSIKNMKDDEYLEKLAKSVEKSKLKYILFGAPGPNLMDENPDVRKKEIDDAVNFYRKASKYFKLTVCNTTTGPLINPEFPYHHFEKHGSNYAKDCHWEWAVNGFKILGELAEELDFYFAFEIHNCYLHDTVESTTKLVDLIGKKNVGINLDYGNIILRKDATSLKESIEKCGEKLYYVHLKNLFIVKGIEHLNYIMCPLSDGIINNREFLKLLKENNYKGPICIEAPREGDREYFAKQDLEYIKSILSEI